MSNGITPSSSSSSLLQTGSVDDLASSQESPSMSSTTSGATYLKVNSEFKVGSKKYEVTISKGNIFLKPKGVRAYLRSTEPVELNQKVEDHRQIQSGILMCTDIQANIRLRYLPAKDVSDYAQIHILSFVSNSDLIDYFYSKKTSKLSSEESKKFVELIYQLPAERIIDLTADLIESTKHRVTPLEPLADCLRLFISTLPKELMEKLYLEVDVNLIPQTLWEPQKIKSLECILKNAQFTQVCNLPAEKFAETCNLLTENLTSPSCAVYLLLARLKMEYEIAPPDDNLCLSAANTELCSSNEYILDIILKNSSKELPGKDEDEDEDEGFAEIEAQSIDKVQAQKNELLIETPNPQTSNDILSWKSPSIDITKLTDQLHFSEQTEMKAIIDFSMNHPRLEPLLTLIKAKANCISRYSQLIAECYFGQLFKQPTKVLPITNSASVDIMFAGVDKQYIRNTFFPALLNSQPSSEKNECILRVITTPDSHLLYFLDHLPTESAIRLCHIINNLSYSEQNRLLARYLPEHLISNLPNKASQEKEKVRTIVNISLLLSAPLSPDVKQSLLTQIAEYNPENIIYLARHLPQYALSDFFESIVDDEMRALLFDRLYPNNKSDFEAFLSLTRRYLSSPLEPSLKKKFINNIQCQHLIQLVKHLSRNENEELLSYLDKKQHKRVLQALLPESPETNESEFCELLNALPINSIKLMYQKLSGLPEPSKILFSPDLSEETRVWLTTLIPPDLAQILIFSESDDIDKLPPRLVMQLNRKLSFGVWTDIYDDIKDEHKHLWVDFVSLEQTKQWLSDTERKKEIEVFLELPAARSIDFLTHINPHYIAKELLTVSPDKIAMCILKLAPHSSCLELLVEMKLQDSPKGNLEKVFDKLREILETKDKVKQEAIEAESKKVVSKTASVTKVDWESSLNTLKEFLNQWCAEKSNTDSQQLRLDTSPKVREVSKILATFKNIKYHEKGIHLANIRYQSELQTMANQYQQRGIKRDVWSFKNNNRREKNLPFVFHADLSGLCPTLNEPLQSTPQIPFPGTHKEVKCVDSQSILFQSKTRKSSKTIGADFTESSYIAQRQLLINLISQAAAKKSNISSISPGLIGIQPADNTLVVARGQQDLYHAFKNTTAIPLVAFRPPCFDLSTMHSLGYFIGDIKAENFIYQELAISRDGLLHRLPQPQLKYIDLQSLYCTTYPNPPKTSINYPTEYSICGTYGYAPVDLLLLSNESKLLNEHGCCILKAKDEYAFLITLLESVSTEFRALLKEQFDLASSIDKTELLRRLRQPNSNDNLQAFRVGILSAFSPMSEENQVIADLINKLILPKYTTLIEQFLQDPITYPLPSDISLYDVINWNAEL